jgi:hypothetical protein
VFVEKLTPFLEEFLNKIEMLNYPKSSMHLLIHNKVGGTFFFSGDKIEHFLGLQAEYHKELIDGFFKKHSSEYMSAKLIDVADNFDEFGARELAV